MRKICALCLFAMTPLLHAAVDEDDVRDDLEQRWFDIEVVIFERLDTFEYNTIEALTSTDTPTWRSGLVEYQNDKTASTVAANDALPLLDPKCVGFPSLPEALAPHPILAALIEAERIAAELDQEALLGDILENEALNAEEQTEAQQSEAQTNAQSEAGTDRETGLAEASTEAVSVLPTSSPVLVAPEPTPDDIYRENVRLFEQALIDTSFTYAGERQLTAQVRAINRQRHLRPLFHEKWRQMVPARNAPLPIRIDLPELTPRLTGTISVTVARYLHFATDLWYTTTDSGQYPRIMDSQGASQVIPAETRYIHIQDSRRMRSEELHYIDHPKIGILVYIEPLPIPEALLAEKMGLSAAEATY